MSNKRERFSLESAVPASWIIRARFLMDSAKRVNWLEPNNGHLSRIDMMLIGMAIESLLKATMVARGVSPTKIRNNGSVELSKKFKTHNLSHLASQIECNAFSISATEHEMLDKLTKSIKWGGRYPVPSVDNEMDILSTSSTERENAISFFLRLHNHISPRHPYEN